MKIYSMTATFGKLEHKTLTLKPGLNVIYAPNEWGKSTWCSFLVAMLYGLDSRGKSSKNPLPEKERFNPWSGNPMSGRMDLNWQGRDITIERASQGRIPLGRFQAYETATGLPIPELNANNCGQMLLGVEQSVFHRAGFIRLTDLPVTQDEALRRRLNALVTTGDESGDGIRLEEGLRELKNRCRLNRRSGLIPQAEARREAIQTTLDELSALSSQQDEIRRRIAENETQHKELTNHLAGIHYSQSLSDQQHVEEAKADLQEAETALETLEAQCRELPSMDEVQAELDRLEAFRQKIISTNSSLSRIPIPPKAPPAPPIYQGVPVGDIQKNVERDTQKMNAASSRQWMVLLGLGIGMILAGALLFFLLHTLFCIPLLAVGLGLGIWGSLIQSRQMRVQEALSEKYGSPFPSIWQGEAQRYLIAFADFKKQDSAYQQKLEEQNTQLDALHQEYTQLCGQQSLDDRLQRLQHELRLLNARMTAQTNVQTARAQYAALEAVSHPAQAPQQPDRLDLSMEQTQQQLDELRQEHQHLTNRLGVYAGRMESLGEPSALRAELDALNQRIQKLEDTYAALTLAHRTLAEATAQLQRRFAPRITRQAQKLFSDLTQGRYDRVKLDEDFGLQTAAQQEDTLHDILWRSDGTMDQLYLALRLAVAEELTPKAPLILDDALIRFDEERMQSAMTILRQLANTKQVILFTCQKREVNAVGEK